MAVSAARRRDLVDLVDQHTRVREKITGRIRPAVRRVVLTFPEDGWYDHAAIKEMAEGLARTVESAQRASATATSAYLARVATIARGSRVEPARLINPARLRQGVTHAGVFGRLADQYRYKNSLGIPVPEIKKALVSRALAVVETDMQLALTHQAREFMSSKSAAGVSGYRRVIRPEMSSGTGVCGLCIVASDQVYRTDQLLPIHANCHCDVMPIIGDTDLGRRLNDEELNRVYEESGGSDAESLRSTQFRIEENGEIGPVLVNKEHEFRGPAEVAAA